MVFLDKSNSKNQGRLAVARQREREIATKGVASTRLPTGIPKVNYSKQTAEVEAVRNLVRSELEQHDDLIHGLSVRIYHTAQLAEKMLENDESSLACVTMRKLKGLHQEYIQLIFIRKAMEAFREHHEYALVNMKDPEKDLTTIKSFASSMRVKAAASNSYMEAELLAQLKKRKFFPIVLIKNGRVVFNWTDTAPFCNHEVAYQRAMEIAVKGYSRIQIPSGYEKTDKPCAKSLLLISQKEQKAAYFDEELGKLDLEISILVKAATRCLADRKMDDAILRMKEMDKVQHKYLTILKVLEALKAFESHILYGLTNLKLAGDTLKDLCDISEATVVVKNQTNEEYLSRLKDKKFYPRLFPLLGEGVRIFYRDSAATNGKAMIPKSSRPETKNPVALPVYQTRRQMVV